MAVFHLHASPPVAEQAARVSPQAGAFSRPFSIAVPLLAILVGGLAVANYAGWIHNYFAADSWVLVGSITQADWTLLDLLPFRFWQVEHSLNPTFYYAPTLMVITWLSVKLGGFSPEPYHIVMILLHLGTTLFLFSAVLQLTGSRLKATIAGAIFAVHFASTEAVGWFGSNSHPIVGLFESMSLLLYVRYLITRRQAWWYGALLAVTAGALAQASALVWFPVLACLDILYSRAHGDSRDVLRRLMVLGVLLAAIFLLEMQSLSLAKGGYRYSFGPWIVLNALYYPVSTIIPSLEENAVSLYRDLFQASADWSAFTRLMGMREAFNILLTASLSVVAAVMLWAKGGWMGRFAVIGFAFGLTPFLLINGQGYRYLYTPLMFFSLAAANTVGGLYGALQSTSRTAALTVVAIVPLFVVFSFAESQRQLFWWEQAGIVVHNSLHEMKQLQPTFPEGSKVIFGGLPDTIQRTNAQVWRRGIQEAVRAVYDDRTLRIESYSKGEVERQFREELKGAPNTYGFVYDDWRLHRIHP